MALQCSQETVLGFLIERGGRVKNVDLIEHFRSAIPSEPGKKAAAKEAFKRYVDSVAVVKVDNGEKYVCLKKKFRGALGDGLVLNSPADPSNVSELLGRSENEDAKQEITPGLGCGSTGPGVSGNTSVSNAEAQETALGSGSGGTSNKLKGENTCGAEMGNQATRTMFDQDEGAEEQGKLEGISEIAAAEESPLGVSKGVLDRTVPDALEGPSDQTIPQSRPEGRPTQPAPSELESESKVSHWLRRKPSGDQSTDEGHMDLPGSDINTPKGSRKSFLEHMISSSPQVRRSMALRSSVYLSTRSKDSGRSDVDAASLHSSSGTVYDENAPVALEPLEHEWMMCASDGEWESLRRLLDTEPGLVCKKDFVTGFTCLHWAAKLGKTELLALLVTFATRRGIPVDVNARSSAGYTPLHLAAMHNHMEVVKLLVGAYDADVEARDYSGKKPSQYLRGKVAHDVLDIVGAGAEVDAVCTDGGEASGWRLSKVLQANLRPLKLLNHSASEDDVSTVGENAGLAKDKVLHRKTSLRGLRPRLSKIRGRTQIVHSTSLFGHFEKEARETSGSVRSRPKSNLFG